MLLGKNHISKAISSVLLVVLLLVHSVKFLHSHPGNGSCSKDLHSSSVVKNSSDCSVCNYQLAKDTVAQVFFQHEPHVPCQNLIQPHLDSFYKTSFHSAFEGRGPPFGI